MDYGPDYAAFSNQGLDGGFFKSDLAASADTGSALIVFYSDRLEETQSKVEQAGGRIVKPVFTFPDGRRFQFAEPSGNEFGVWSEAVCFVSGRGGSEKDEPSAAVWIMRGRGFTEES